MMTVDALRQRVAGIRWYHTIDLGQGVITPGIDNTPLRLSKLDFPTSFAGRSVLDIGAWDGFFSFEAERRGAARVVASDYFAWHGQALPEGEGKAGFTLARDVLGSRVEDLEIDVMDLSPKRAGVFDVVFFLGVLYHLRHPLLALERVASVTGDMLILETVVDMVGLRRPAMTFYPDRELNHDPTNWWGPNVPAIEGMLRDVGFERVATVTPSRSAPYRIARAIYHKARGKNGLVEAYRQDRAALHAWKRRT
jgi:tRNA (mo5U34)-methyltransferase